MRPEHSKYIKYSRRGIFQSHFSQDRLFTLSHDSVSMITYPL